MRANIANNYFALIDANAHAESHSAFAAPLFIELPQLAPHPQRCARAIFCVLRHAKTAHVPPNGHDRVTDEFIERASIAENN